MPTPPRRRLRSTIPVANRAAYTRVGNADLMVNSPDGFPSGQPPVHWLGLDSTGLASPIGPHGPFTNGYAEALPVVMRATALISGPITSVPFRVLEQGYAGNPQIRPRWLMDPMLLRPDGRFVSDVYPEAVQLPRGLFFTEWIRSAIWWGIGAFITQLDEAGQPLAGTLRNVNGQLLSTERDAAGALHWVLGAEGSSDERAVFDRSGQITLGPVTYRLVVLRNPHSPVDSEGMSKGVFALAPSAFRLSSSVDVFSQSTFRSGVPAGYLQVDQSMSSMTQEQADALKAKWMANHGGDRRSIAVLNAFTKFVPINLDPVSAQLAEVTRLSIASVAFAFGLSPENLGVSLSGSATYANVRDHFQDLKDFGIGPWIGIVQDTLSSLLPGSQSVVVNLDGFANPPLKERFEAYAVGIAAGIVSADEVRQNEGLPPMAELPPVPAPAGTQITSEPESAPTTPAPAPVTQPVQEEVA